MDWLWELLKMLLMVGGALVVLAWLGSGRRQRRADSTEDSGDVDDMGEIGAAGGLLGGEMDDLFIGRFALRRRRKE